MGHIEPEIMGLLKTWFNVPHVHKNNAFEWGIFFSEYPDFSNYFFLISPILLMTLFFNKIF